MNGCRLYWVVRRVADFSLAGAAKKPVVATDATGAVDSIVNGVTGLIVLVGDAKLWPAQLAASSKNLNRLDRWV